MELIELQECLKFLKWTACSLWSFGPNFACGREDDHRERESFFFTYDKVIIFRKKESVRLKEKKLKKTKCVYKK